MTVPLTQHPLPPYTPFPPELINTADSVKALYIHVPFCTTKCHYCDFYSIAGHLDQTDAFLAALQTEIEIYNRLLGTISPQTIFIGGGTPTLLSADHLHQLLTLITKNINTQNLAEFSVEANPNTFDIDRAAALAQHAVNRLSFGAQSFHANELRTLQRDHDPENVPKAFAIARAAGITNLNLDLIFGIPGQTLASWNSSLDQALALKPQHMSCYSLTYEPNTAMTARMKKGEFTPIDEDLELDMFNLVHTRLQSENFTRYEISNYARAGEQCQHNIHYWKASNWLAWGPSAAAHLNRHRWKNAANLTHYMSALNVTNPQLPLTQHEHLTPRQWAAETAIFWLRLTEGLNYAEFQQRTGVDAKPLLEPALKKYVDLQLVELHPTHIQLTEKATPISNRILRDALAAFD
jgi:oxygen-independent coproporphyrinogen-3 oxidase